ncbi:MAG: class I SAM-dependent methyltransferase [Deltaproteobacteria bacterium]|nr:class I SAM-dependent methyltransferase [Deltaproteobacteria bacterium]
MTAPQATPTSVHPDGKAEVIDDFDAIAGRYDLLTRMNPGYLQHLRWSAERLRLAPGARILDLCCGTGLSTRALMATYPDAQEITGLDASAGMIRFAMDTLTPGTPRPRGLARLTTLPAPKTRANVRFVVGDAMDPAAAGATGPFDGILMAYGIRNVPNADHCLAALLPLLAPGAPICFHEYSVADSKVAKAVWNAVSLSVIAPLGIAATRNVRMWNYLRESVNRMDGVSAFERRLAAHGFTDIETLPMSGWQRGIVHSFIARRPRS